MQALGTYIPFSLPDSSTRLHVFVFKVKKLEKGQEIVDVLIPNSDYGFRSQPHMVYRASETGFFNNRTVQVSHG